jgi:hypothetical protein
MRRFGLSPARLGLLLLLLAAVATRLWRLDAPSPWEDDYLNLDRALLPLADMWRIQKYQGPADTIFDFQPPLSYALQHIALAIDQSTLAARIPSVVAGVLTVAGMGLLGARLFGRSVGVVSAVLVAFLVVPIGFSQAIKAYAVFLCLAVASMWLLVRAVAENTWRSWLAYGACALGMLYGGYQGAPTFAVQLVWAGLASARLARGENTLDGRRRWIRFGAVALGVCVAYLPWLPGVLFLNDFLSDPGVNRLVNLDLAFAAKILGGFISLDDELSRKFVLPWCVVAALGLWSALRRQQYAGLLLILAWAVVSALALFSSKSFFRAMLDSRHFVMVFPAFVLFAALGVARLGEWGARALPWPSAGRVTGPAMAGLACLALLWPSFADYPRYYHRGFSIDRELFQWLAEERGDVTALDFQGYQRNTRRMAARWMIPGRFEEAGTFAGPGYRLLFDVDTVYTKEAADRPPRPGVPVKSFPSMFLTNRVTLVGLANRSPLVMDPGSGDVYRYVENFRSRRFYEDCQQAANMALDPELGELRPSRYSRPAQATWAFEVPEGMTLDAVHLEIDAALYKKHSSLPADSVLMVESSDDGEHFVPLGIIGQERFPVRDGKPVETARPFFEEMGFYHGRCRETVADFDMEPKLAGGSRLYLRVAYRPGQVEGFFTVSGLRLAAFLTRKDLPPPERSPLAVQAGYLLRNAGAVGWREEEDGTDVGRFAFVAPGFEALLRSGLPAGTPAERDRFLARHPELQPVFILTDAAGRPALFLYDPALTRPGIPLSAAAPNRRVHALPSSGETQASVRLAGDIAMPTLRIGGETLDIAVIAPRGSQLTLTPGGRGRLRFVPDWTDPEQAMAGMSYARDVVPSRNLQGELTCAEGRDCAFAYTFVSALPITELRLNAFPRVFGNPCRKCEPNKTQVNLSTDGGKTYRPLVEETGEECVWTPANANAYRRVVFDAPVTTLILAFELQKGTEAGFLSPVWNVDGMYVEADLDASRLPPLRLVGPDVGVSLVDPGKNDLTLFLRPSPWPLSNRTSPR